MKRNLLVAMLLCFVGTLKLSSQAVVSDPTSVAQRALIFVEEMAEAIEEKYAMYEQIQEAKNNVELVKKGYDRYKKVMNWVKEGQEIISIIQEGENIQNRLNTFRKSLLNSEYLNIEEKYKLYLTGFQIYSESINLIKTARKYISEFKEKEDAGLSSSERLQLLQNIRKEMSAFSSKFGVLQKDAENRESLKSSTCDRYQNLYNSFSVVAK